MIVLMLDQLIEPVLHYIIDNDSLGDHFFKAPKCAWNELSIKEPIGNKARRAFRKLTLRKQSYAFVHVGCIVNGRELDSDVLQR